MQDITLVLFIWLEHKLDVGYPNLKREHVYTNVCILIKAWKAVQFRIWLSEWADG